MTHQLPVVSCDDCGLCCTTVGYPRYFWDPELPGKADEYWTRVPPELRNEVLEYARNATPQQELSPCIWLEPGTQRCRHYEIRPRFCREFEMGGTDCRRLRLDNGIGDANR